MINEKEQKKATPYNQWCINAALFSGKGKIRKTQEDAWYLGYSVTNLNPVSAFPKTTSFLTSEPGGLLAVFDGIGEGKQGLWAARTAASQMKALNRITDRGVELAKALPEWSELLNRKIRRDYPGAGTTMAMVLFQNCSVRIAHIGDSRVYRLHQGDLEQMTHDHTQAELMLRHGMISREEALVHPARHTLTRYYGMENDLIASAIEISSPVLLCETDRYILCTDGLYEMLPAQKMKALSNGAENAESCAQLLYDQALAVGGRDNLTVIVCDVSNNLSI